MKANVGEDADCRALVAAAVEQFGGLDVLVNNAGITKFAKHTDLDGLDARRLPAHLQHQCRRGVPDDPRRPSASGRKRRRRGRQRVVDRGRHRHGSSIAYAASKGALNTMTLSLARALAPNIRINTVCPGYIGSGWFTKYQGDAEESAYRRSVAKTTPLQLASQPEDIADSILFFAGPESRHVTGEFMIIDAGTHLGFAPLRAK